MQKRVLLLGGYGVVGSQVAAMLRRHHPELRLVIAGRRIEAAARLADSLSDAEAVCVDVHAVDPLAAVPGAIDAVVMLVQDHDDVILRGALRRSIPYLDITRTNSALARAYVAAALHTPSSPVLFASNWMAGVPAVLAMHQAGKLAATDAIALSILFHANDKGGPDSEGVSASLAEPFEARRAGGWRKMASMEDAALVDFPSGLKRPVYRIAMADMMTLAQATGARDVAVRLGLDNAMTGRITRWLVRSGVWALLQSDRLGWLRKRLGHNPTTRGAPHEIVIDVSGTTSTGVPARLRASILDPAGQSHLTAVGVVAHLRRLIGLGAAPLRPGVAVPETAPDGIGLLALLEREGVRVAL